MFEFFDGATVLALGLSLIAEEQLERIGLLAEPLKACGQTEGTILGIHLVSGGFVQCGGEESGLHSGAALERVLSVGDTFDSGELLGAGGPVEGDGGGTERG